MCRVRSAVVPRRLALLQSIWVRQIGEPGFFSAPKLTDLYQNPSMSTLGKSVKPGEAEVERTLFRAKIHRFAKVDGFVKQILQVKAD